jgi:hypothetical protein
LFCKSAIILALTRSRRYIRFPTFAVSSTGAVVVVVVKI